MSAAAYFYWHVGDLVISSGGETHVRRMMQGGQEFVARHGKLAIALHAWAWLPNPACLLSCSGPRGLPTLRRRLLTGYALAFNHRRHRYRSGQPRRSSGAYAQPRTTSWLCMGLCVQAILIALIDPPHDLRGRLITDSCRSAHTLPIGSRPIIPQEGAERAPAARPCPRKRRTAESLRDCWGLHQPRHIQEKQRAASDGAPPVE